MPASNYSNSYKSSMKGDVTSAYNKSMGGAKKPKAKKMGKSKKPKYSTGGTVSGSVGGGT